jgi:hypothetical protein
MRGLLVVRSRRFANKTWLANRYVPHSGRCTELEDNPDGSGGILPQGADCGYCFPDVYLDYTRISDGRRAANVSQFSPDQLQAIEVYLGAAETPIRYAGGFSGCGVIVFHTRAVDSKPRIFANRQDMPTRSRLFVNASVSAAKSGNTCENCDPGAAKDFTVGYTLRDRWVISGRYADWKADNPAGPQSINLRQVLVEWYPHPEPARLKWFLNVGGGLMGVDINVSHLPDYTDRFTASGLPSFVVGTGVDLTVFRRFVVTPFLSHSRSMAGNAVQDRCVPSTPPTGGPFTDCFSVPGQPRSFTLSQLGTRFGWR